MKIDKDFYGRYFVRDPKSGTHVFYNEADAKKWRRDPFRNVDFDGIAKTCGTLFGAFLVLGFVVFWLWLLVQVFLWIF